ncbi:MAG: hypothetical protein KGJ55_05425 [Gammaproteobacteria bacterium]|nr:hypothetical protein [Gammaproteobacteria bacterium]
MQRFLILCATLALSACVHDAYCLKPQRYENARSIPPLHGSGDLQIPRSPNALVVPPPPASNVPFGRQVPDPKHPGETVTQCLDQPPPMPKSDQIGDGDS